MDRHHVEPIVEVGAESVGRHFGTELLVGRREQPRLKRDGVIGANGQDFLVLDRPQQFGLGRAGQLTDFVEEDRSPARGDEQPGVITVGARESARTCPKSWFSSKSCGMAAQLIAKNFSSRAGPSSWSAQGH